MASTSLGQMNDKKKLMVEKIMKFVRITHQKLGTQFHNLWQLITPKPKSTIARIIS